MHRRISFFIYFTFQTLAWLCRSRCCLLDLLQNSLNRLFRLIFTDRSQLTFDNSISSLTCRLEERYILVCKLFEISIIILQIPFFFSKHFLFISIVERFQLFKCSENLLIRTQRTDLNLFPIRQQMAKLEEELTMSRRCITLRQVNIKESPPVCLLYLVEQRNQAGGMKCSHLKYNL